MIAILHKHIVGPREQVPYESTRICYNRILLGWYGTCSLGPTICLCSIAISFYGSNAYSCFFDFVLELIFIASDSEKIVLI